MRLTYATDFDINNINNWSGLGYYYGFMLKTAGFDIDYLNNINTPFSSVNLLKQRLMNRIKGEIYSPRFDVNVSKTYAQIIEKRICNGSVIFSPNTVLLANLQSSNKRVLYADATFERLLNLYPNYLKLSRKSITDGHEVDRQAIQNCDLLIYTSQWAAESAINYYDADPEKIFIAPFGANLAQIPVYSDIKTIIAKRQQNEEIHLLFLGVDWERKGGGKAVELLQSLQSKGLNVTLHIVGIKGKLPIPEHHKIINHGFIQKGSKDGEEKLVQIFSKCHFLILPTKADCTPVAFSEANAYGIPCITTDVGGNSCIVQNHVNGMALPLSSFTKDASNFILQVTSSAKEYEQLSLSSFECYATELNWESTGKKIFKLINEL